MATQPAPAIPVTLLARKICIGSDAKANPNEPKAEQSIVIIANGFVPHLSTDIPKGILSII